MLRIYLVGEANLQTPPPLIVHSSLNPPEDKDASARWQENGERLFLFIIETQNHGNGSDHRSHSSFSPQIASGTLIYLLA